MAYLTAPGTGIYSTFLNNRYSSQSGTSMAASQVSGVVALLLSANNSLTDSQIRQILTSTSGNNILSSQSLLHPNLSNANSTLISASSSTVQMSYVVANTAKPKVLPTLNSTQLYYRYSAEISLTEPSLMSVLA
jgi:subtilisin family serine protease